MNRRFLGVSLIVLLLFVGFDLKLAAQTTNPCLNVGMWWWPDPIPPGCYPYGPGEGPFSYQIACPNTSCSPPPCDCGNQAGSPILLATGNTYIKQNDLNVPGLGGGLEITRSWNSFLPLDLASHSIGFFGQKWRSTYEEIVFVGTDHYIKYVRSDGSVWSFGYANPGYAVAAPTNTNATLAITQDGLSWLLTFKNGDQRKFNISTGLLSTITDHNGNTTQLSYDSSYRLTTVASPAGQHLYFSYGSGSTSNLITSVTTDFGTSLSYSYDTQGRLIQVTRPDQTTVSFIYNGQSQITSVTDNNGKVLESHTYDSNGRGLTSSLANGVNSLSIIYPE